MKRAGTSIYLDEVAYLSQITNYFMRKLTPAEIARAKSHFQLGTNALDVCMEWKKNGFPKEVNEYGLTSS